MVCGRKLKQSTKEEIDALKKIREEDKDTKAYDIDEKVISRLIVNGYISKQ